MKLMIVCSAIIKKMKGNYNNLMFICLLCVDIDYFLYFIIS